jgi:membrane protein
MGSGVSKFWLFAVRVVRQFFHNKGILLAGGVAYNTLLSIVPLFVVILLGLSIFMETEKLLAAISAQLHFLLPGVAGELMQTVAAALEARAVVSGVGILVLLFFSSMAFRMLEEAIGAILNVSKFPKERRFWVSALIPYAYMVIFTVAIILLTAASTLLEALADKHMVIGTWDFAMTDAPRIGFHLLGLLGLCILFTSIYKVLPVARIQFRRALVGGVTAALLWDGVRWLLVWYFGNISLVNLIYGSLATVVIFLLVMEIAAIIILLGAQVIAELERSARAGLLWYEDPKNRRSDVGGRRAGNGSRRADDGNRRSVAEKQF